MRLATLTLVLVASLTACEERTVPLCAPWADFGLPAPKVLNSCQASRCTISFPTTDDEELLRTIGIALMRTGFRQGKSPGHDVIMRRERDRLQIEFTVKSGTVDLKKGTYQDWELEAP